MAAKAKAEAAALQTIQDYLKSEAFFTAIDNAVEKAVDKQLGKIIERLTKVEEENRIITERLDNNDGRLLGLETRLDSKENEIKCLNDLLSQQKTTAENLKVSLNEAEQYSRRNCLKFYGVKEVNGATEKTDDTICKIVNDRLGVALSPNDIDRSHRIAASKRDGDEAEAGQGATRSATKTTRPRAIIVKLTTYRKRREIIKSRRKLKGTGIAIDEALTKTNQELLRAAKQHEKVIEAWPSDGRIVVLLPATSGKTIKKVIHSKDELKIL